MRHVAARLEWRHRIEEFPARPQHSDSHWPAHFVPRKRQKVTTEVLHIDRKMRNGLGGVDKHHRSCPMCRFADFLRRIDSTKDVRYVRERYELGPLGQQSTHLVESQAAI